MVYISVSITAPVNPPGASSSPTLTQSDLWAALVAKARHPEEFVPEIARSTILHEDEQGLTRNVLFGGSMAERGEVEEHIKYYSPSKVDFHVPATGMSVSNIISESAGGDSSSGQPELFLTFTFDFPHPEITDPNSDEARKQREKYLGLGRQVVPHSVEVARKMKVEGRLEKLT